MIMVEIIEWDLGNLGTGSRGFQLRESQGVKETKEKEKSRRTTRRFALRESVLEG